MVKVNEGREGEKMANIALLIFVSVALLQNVADLIPPENFWILVEKLFS